METPTSTAHRKSCGKSQFNDNSNKSRIQNQWRALNQIANPKSNPLMDPNARNGSKNANDQCKHMDPIQIPTASTNPMATQERNEPSNPKANPNSAKGPIQSGQQSFITSEQRESTNLRSGSSISPANKPFHNPMASAQCGTTRAKQNGKLQLPFTLHRAGKPIQKQTGQNPNIASGLASTLCRKTKHKSF